MLFMQKERNMSEYIDFIAYQDDAIIQRPLRYYRRRGQPHPQPKGWSPPMDLRRAAILMTSNASWRWQIYSDKSRPLKNDKKPRFSTKMQILSVYKG